MNLKYVSVGGKTIRFLLFSLIITASGCAAPKLIESAPSQFGDVESSRIIESELEFIENVAGKQLNLLNKNVEASLVFNENGTATGLLAREGEDVTEMNMDWVWENTYYCRTGTVGEIEVERKCESVRLFPSVGILLTYIDADDADEYWLFE